MISFFFALPGAVSQGIIWGIMAIGVYITYKILDIADLSVDGTFATGGAVLVVATTSGMPIGFAIALATIAGAVAGFVTGILHTKLGIPAILAGILTQLGMYSINLRIMSGMANVAISARKYKLLVTLSNIPLSILVGGIFAVLVIAVLYCFFGTQMGQGFRATGCNASMAKANGINVNAMKILGLTASNAVVALSGAFLAQYQGFADINMGRGAIVIGLAAVIIGEVIFGKVFKNYALRLLAAVFGGIIYYVVMTFVLRLGLDANDLKLISAIIVAIFLAVPYLRSKYLEARPKPVPVKEDK